MLDDDLIGSLSVVVMRSAYLHKLLKVKLFVPECSVNGYLMLKDTRSV